MKQLLTGLYYCHRNNILHRDIKGSNLLIDNNGILKLADFGLARSFDESLDQIELTPRVQNKYYGAPEVVITDSKFYDAKIDIWSAGCTIMQILKMLNGQSHPQN